MQLFFLNTRSWCRNWWEYYRFRSGIARKVTLVCRSGSCALRLSRAAAGVEVTFEREGAPAAYRFVLTNWIHQLPVLVDVWLNEPYAGPDFEGRTVVDVGGFDGDSAVYFISRGARKVIVLEPFPQNALACRSNLHLNAGAGNFEVLNAAIGANPGSVRVQADKLAFAVDTPQKEAPANSVEVPVVTLAWLVKKYGLDGAVLKMDCEGAEQQVIAKADKPALQAFSDIVMEVHGDPSNISARLSEAGFGIYSNQTLGPDLFIMKARRQGASAPGRLEPAHA
jgi:FkbM family methyltransferase